MPAVRDFSQSFTALATGTTLVMSVPAHQVGDLLVAIFVADTGAGVWSAPGWAHIAGSPSANGCQMACMTKMATASEPADYTFTSTLAESYTGAMLSIQDVDTTNPLGATPVISFVAQAAAAKFNMQTVTTNVANALVLYASTNSVAGVPALLEGPVFGLVGADGLAESLGVGWGFKAVAGVTPANIGVSNVGSGTGVKMVLQIAPPGTGATVIPPYCAADASTYLSPLNGLTAFNANIAPAATADTGFGVSLGGIAAVDATVATAADVGINSFHSALRITNLTGTKTLSGAEMVFAVANRPNVTGKNILCHIGPSTEGQLQRFSSVASGRGIWFGMRSGAAADYKIWQSYGVELGSLRHQPIVINNLAANAKAINGTLNPAAVLALGWWVSGSGVTTTAWDFTSLWVLGTTTVCGGNATQPVDITGLVAAAADGKERRNVIRQGSDQAIAYGPLQFGNSGADPTYLDLNATAFEFPGQYNAAKKRVTYNSVDNVAGLTYNAGATDTIKHRDSVVSSPSRYHWRIHPSSSAAASYDFSGLALIGAGDVVLRNVTTFAGMSFVGCALVTQNSAPVSGSAFRNSLLLSNLPSAISACTFASGGTGHAIEITTPGTYTFSGNTFTGYGAAASTNAAVYNNSGGAVVLNISGGGSTPTVRNGAAATTTVLASATVVVSGLVSGTRVRASKVLDGAVLFNGAESLGAVNFSTDFAGAVALEARKASNAPYYQPWVTQITTVIGQTASVTALQQLDE